MNKKGFTLVELLVVIAIIGILAATLFPAVGSMILNAKLTGTANVGKKIHTAIVAANLESKKGSIWPCTTAQNSSSSGNASAVDVRKKAYSNSTDYFWDAIDGENITKPTERRPTVELETNWLSDGVDAYSGSGQLLAENVAWCIAANVNDSLPDYIPVLYTRNLDGSDLVLAYDGSSTTKFSLGKDDRSSKPYGDQAFVVVRFGGAAESFKAKAATVEDLFFGQAFDVSNLKVKTDTLKYLNPWETVTPKSK